MPIEVRCESCGRLLRVADEHAGKALRCPACNHISKAPSAAGPSLLETQAHAPQWHMRTPEGTTYGPVDDRELDRWIAEGRLAADCQLASSPSGPWLAATSKFPHLKPVTPPQVAIPPTQTFAPAFQPASPFSTAPPAINVRYHVPHRGGLILILGLLGFVVGCPIFSLMAWVMGSGDLREMQTGRMDPSGESLTRAGQILGMLLAIPWIIGAVIVLIVILVAAAHG
jgi:phage FluMu protein Com